MKEDLWILESGDTEDGPWHRWMYGKNLKFVPPTTFDECMEIVETREKRKAESRGLIRDAALRIEPTFIRARNISTEEIIPLWALDEDFK